MDGGILQHAGTLRFEGYLLRLAESNALSKVALGVV